MLNSIPRDWITANTENFNSEVRFYIDPRGVEYPVISGTPTYIPVSGLYHRPGRYMLGSSVSYLFTPSASHSAEILISQQSSTLIDSKLIELTGGYTITLKSLATGGYSLVLVGGSTVTLTGGTVQPVQRIGYKITYGGAVELYVDGVSVDSDTAPALTTNPTILTINGDNNSHVSYVRLFDGYAASDNDFLYNWEHVGNEEIYFAYNLTSYGRTRCNINRAGNNLVTSYIIDQPGMFLSNNMTLGLLNLSGEFSDDLFAAYDPSVGSYNGTSAQNYLAGRVGFEMETWQPSQVALFPETTLYPSTTLYPAGGLYTFETMFRGYIKPGSFKRSTQNMGLSTLSITAEDAIVDIARRVSRRSYTWENYYLAAGSGTSSVLHEISWLATRRYIKNYVTNASFENTTIGNSWAGDATFARDTTAVLMGTYCGKFTGTDKYIASTINFVGSNDELVVNNVFTGSIYVYSASAIDGKIRLTEATASADNGYTEVSYTHAGNGWEKWEASRTIAYSTSVRLSLSLISVGAWTNVPVDCAMVKRGASIPWWVDNTADGSSAVSTASQAAEQYYDWLGIDTDTVTYVHPWAWLEEKENVWENLKEIATALGARVFHINTDNILTLRSGLASDPTASLGTLAAANGISGVVKSSYNSITVNGIYIDKATAEQNVWMADASTLSKESGVPKFKRTLQIGNTIPDETLDGTAFFEAIYGEPMNANDAKLAMNTNASIR